MVDGPGLYTGPITMETDDMRQNNVTMQFPVRAPLLAGALALALTGCVATPYAQDKVTICHKNKKTLVLPQSAVSAHLGHGDVYGPCD